MQYGDYIVTFGRYDYGVLNVVTGKAFDYGEHEVPVYPICPECGGEGSWGGYTEPTEWCWYCDGDKRVSPARWLWYRTVINARYWWDRHVVLPIIHRRGGR